MAIEKMKLVKISGAIENFNQVGYRLMEAEVFHPRSASKLFSSDMGFVPLGEDNSYSKRLADLNEVAEKNGIELKLLNLESQEEFGEVDTEYIAEIREKLLKYDEQLSSLNEQQQVLKSGIGSFEHFRGLDVDLNDIAECRFIKVRFGHMPKESYKKLGTVSQDNPYLIFYPASEDTKDYWGVYFAPVDMVDEIDEIFAFLYFEPVSVPGASGTVDEVIRECKNSLEILETQIRDIRGEMDAFITSEKEHLDYIYSKLLYLDSLSALRSYAVRNETGFVLLGYVPAGSVRQFKSDILSAGSVKVEYENVQNPKDPTIPVKYKRRTKVLSAMVEPYKFYVDMYGTPSYSDLDITAFVAVTYTRLFGIMFGDLGQGFCLAVIGFLMWKLKKMALGKILIPCGISSMVFGFVFGSVFGFEEMLDPVYEKLGWAGKPLSVMDSINTVLLIAIGIGVLLMIVAMLLNIYACIKRRAFGEALFSQNGLAGIIVYVAGVNLASGFMNGPAPIPNAVCTAMLVGGLLILLIKEIPIGIIDKHPDWKPESIGDFILQNVFELLEYVLSYLSNTVSFLRVGAFVLVHAGMMMVVFSLAGENENIFVIILGNVLVIALEGLLTGIQALRLEYYEMFSRFFEGSGTGFEPITLKKQSNNI